MQCEEINIEVGCLREYSASDVTVHKGRDIGHGRVALQKEGYFHLEYTSSTAVLVWVTVPRKGPSEGYVMLGMQSVILRLSEGKPSTACACESGHGGCTVYTVGGH